MMMVGERCCPKQAMKILKQIHMLKDDDDNKIFKYDDDEVDSDDDKYDEVDDDALREGCCPKQAIMI